MPPFRSGLQKRKINASDSEAELNREASDNEGSITSEEQLILGEVQDRSDDETDTENEEENNVVSDEEQDEVLYRDKEQEEGSSDGDLSSDLEDTDATDSDAETSDNLGEDEDNEVEDEAATDDDVESDKQNQKTVKNSAKDKNKNSKDKVNGNASIQRLTDTISKSSLTPVADKDEYESGDTSDEEDRRNTVGNVPMWWYQEYSHTGYDLDGRKLLKPPQRDHIDEFLKKCEDPEFWRTVRDPATGQDVVLSKGDLELIQRIRSGRVPATEHDEYRPWVEWFTRDVLAAPVRAFPDHKRSFLPSRSERAAVARLAHALRMGWAKTRRQLAAERRARRERRFYDLWGSGADAERGRGVHRHVPAPRRALPGHAESYRPPPEYLLDAGELREWEKLAETPWKRKYTFLPTQHAALRSVGAFPRFSRERFLRCLDLYLAPRAIKMRLTIGAEELVPRLPAPRDLQPFPTGEALALRGHGALVRSAAFDPSGRYILSGSDDGTIKVWETSTGRLVRSVELGGPVSRVAWCPARGLPLLAAAVGARLLLLGAGAALAGARRAQASDDLLQDPPPHHGTAMDERTRSCVTWEEVPPTGERWARGERLAVAHFRPVTHVDWHARGDYVCVTLADAASRAVVVHQLSRRRSQLPFARNKGLVQQAVFHPHKPLLFVATQRAVRVYDLARGELVRRLVAGAQWISCLAPHPAGDNLLVGSYDRKCVWFDLELSAKPYQTLRLHGGAVRSVAFHARYPLFASAGDDPHIVVSHGMVYNDLLQNPLLVPLKQLAGPARREALCVLQLAWHPTQPWLLAAGADATLRLYS